MYFAQHLVSKYFRGIKALAVTIAIFIASNTVSFFFSLSIYLLHWCKIVHTKWVFWRLAILRTPSECLSLMWCLSHWLQGVGYSLTLSLTRSRLFIAGP